jgi:hypothetical protein
MIVHFDPHLMPADQNVKLRAKTLSRHAASLHPTRTATVTATGRSIIHHHLSLPTLGISDVFKASKKIMK